MEIIYGTTNKSKIENVRKILKNMSDEIKIETLKDIEFTEEIVEDGLTFEDNSKIKARAIKKFCDKNDIKGKIIITDDAGLCIDALNGEPGVYTARYAGKNATQEQSLNKVLDKLKNVNDMEKRTATFICVLTAILENGEEIIARGECLGKIAKEYKMLGGLTYAPIFIPEGCEKSMIEMNEEEYEKSHNHREKAMKKLLEEFKKRNL